MEVKSQIEALDIYVKETIAFNKTIAHDNTPMIHYRNSLITYSDVKKIAISNGFVAKLEKGNRDNRVQCVEFLSGDTPLFYIFIWKNRNDNTETIEAESASDVNPIGHASEMAVVGQQRPLGED